MEISLKRNYGFYLVIKADNVNIIEDIEERIYSKTEDGEVDWNIAPKRDINTEILNQITNLLDDLIYYRESDYDSSNLIERLFEKLPDKDCEQLLKKLNKFYETE